MNTTAHWRRQLLPKTIDELRGLLSLNSQSRQGRKDELLDRAADAIVNGCLPTCPVCR